MSFKVGGLATGMDTESMVQKLMEAERIPLTKLQQQQKVLEYKRDAFREINSKLLELDNIVRDMKYQSYYKTKHGVSSDSNIATVRPGTSALDGTYHFEVKKLATNTMNVGKVNSDKSLSAYVGEHSLTTYDENGQEQTYTIDIQAEDTLSDVLKRVNSDSKSPVRMFVDDQSGKIVMESKRTGAFRPDSAAAEITFAEGEHSFFGEYLGFNMAEEKSGTDAVFVYNDGLELTSKENNYTLNGMTVEFQGVGKTSVKVTTDVDAAFDNIKAFVDKYNEVIEVLNTSQTEERFRSYLPLTKEQEEAMTERQIELWEEKAKSGLLRGEAMLRDTMQTLRSSLQSVVGSDGAYNMLSSIGITTTKNYLDGGKLEINEEKLKAAIADNPDDIYQLFVGNPEEEGKAGLIHVFDEALDSARGKIEKQAGKETQTLDNYTLGKQMKDLTKRITDFERRMASVEQRYWNQFTAMEKAISQMNQQSSYLFSQFGGM